MLVAKFSRTTSIDENRFKQIDCACQEEPVRKEKKKIEIPTDSLKLYTNGFSILCKQLTRAFTAFGNLLFYVSKVLGYESNLVPKHDSFDTFIKLS